MSNIFITMKNRTSPFILIAWPAALALLVISSILMYEDYMTSYFGYKLLPTAKVDDYIVPIAVAAIPQTGQILMMFIFGRSTDKRWAVWVAGVLFLCDLATDVVFKSSGTWQLVPLAILESLFVFTLGSEVMFSICGGFILEGLHEFMTVIGQFFGMLGNAVSSMIASAVSTDDNPRHHGSQRN